MIRKIPMLFSIVFFSFLILFIFYLFLSLLIKSGGIYFFYTPSSDFRPETIVENIFVDNMYGGFIFTDNQDSIFFSYFGTNKIPIGQTVKFNLINHRQDIIRYEKVDWAADWGKPENSRTNKEGYSSDGNYKFRYLVFQNYLNIDSGIGYQSVEISKNNKILGYYNSKNGLRNIRWGKNHELYFIETDPSGEPGIIKEIVF